MENDTLYGTHEYRKCLKLLTKYKTNRWARRGKFKGGNLDNLNNILNFFEPALKHICQGRVRKVGSQGIYKDSNNQVIKAVKGHFIADGRGPSWEAYLSTCIQLEGLNWIIRYPVIKYHGFDGQFISYVYDNVMITIDAKRLFEIGLNNGLKVCYRDKNHNQVFSLKECFELRLVHNYFLYDGELINNETAVKEKKSYEFQRFKLQSGVKADYVLFIPFDGRDPYLMANKKAIHKKLTESGSWTGSYRAFTGFVSEHTERAKTCVLSQRPKVLMEGNIPLGIFIDNGVLSDDQIESYKNLLLKKYEKKCIKNFFRSRLLRRTNGTHHVE